MGDAVSRGLQLDNAVVSRLRLREFRVLAPKLFFVGAGPQSHLTMEIILSPRPAPPRRLPFYHYLIYKMYF